MNDLNIISGAIKVNKKAAFHNLGCKVNSYELDVMRQILRDEGYEEVPFHEKADVYVVNTCTVTNIADRKSRQMLHRAKKQNPDAVVVAVGCYVENGTRKTRTNLKGAVKKRIKPGRIKKTAGNGGMSAAWTRMRFLKTCSSPVPATPGLSSRSRTAAISSAATASFRLRAAVSAAGRRGRSSGR